MPRISNYVRDANVTIKDKLLGSSYEGEGLSGPIFETRNFRIEDLIGFFSNNVLIDNVNFNLTEIKNTVDTTFDIVQNLGNSLGSLNNDGSLASISIGFANDLVSVVSTVPDLFTELALSNLSAVPKAFADFLFTIADANEAFANQVLDLATSVAYATADQFNALEQLVIDNTDDIDAITGNITSLTTTVNTNTGDINANALELDIIATRVTTAETSVVALQTDVVQLNTDVNTITGDIATQATQLSLIGTRVTTSEANITNLQSDFTNLSTTVDGNTGNISTNATQISSLNTVVQTANTNIAALQTDVTILETSINNVSGDVTANASDISLLTTNVNTIAGDVTAVQTDVTTLTTTVNNNTGDIATQATQVSLLANRVDTAESNILNTQTNVTSLTTTVNGNTGSIATNASNISILQTNVSTAQADITGIITDIQQIETSVNTVTGDVSANATAISGLGTRVTTAESNITNVQGNITTLQTNLNTQTGRIDTNVQNISTLSTTVNNNFNTLSANITTVDNARISGDSALTSSITSLTATVNGNTSSITTNASAISTVDGKLTASYGLQVNAGGKIAGLKLLADGSTTSSFIAQADTFGVEMPNGTRVLTVNSSGLVLNGSGTFSGSVTITSGPTLSAITAAQNTADTAIVDASDAASAASTAQSTANTAQSTANTAQSTANTANTNATTALNRTVDATGKIVFNPAPSGSGLFMNATNLGYYDGGAWKTYMENNGNFFLSGSGSNGLSWNGSTLTVNGSGVFSGELQAGLVNIANNVISLNSTALNAFGKLSFKNPSGTEVAKVETFYFTPSGGGISIQGTTGANNAELRLGSDFNNNQLWSLISSFSSIQGTSSNIIFNNSSNRYTFGFIGAGSGQTLVRTSSGDLATIGSSLRYKENVVDYDKGLNTISQLRPVYFNYKNEKEIQNAGLIAEELHELNLTEFVRYDLEDRPESIAYEQMVALLIKGMQEQQEQIDALKAEIELLKAK